MIWFNPDGRIDPPVQEYFQINSRLAEKGARRVRADHDQVAGPFAEGSSGAIATRWRHRNRSQFLALPHDRVRGRVRRARPEVARNKGAAARWASSIGEPVL